MDKDRYDLRYSYFCPLTEQRVVSSKAYWVEWCDKRLDKAADEMHKDGDFKTHRILIIAQLLPHNRSWPDRYVMCNLRMVARDPRARCHYDVSGAKSPKIDYVRGYQSAFEQLGPDGEPENKGVLQMRNAIQWDNSRQRSYVHAVHEYVICIHMTVHDMTNLLRKSARN